MKFACRPYAPRYPDKRRPTPGGRHDRLGNGERVSTRGPSVQRPGETPRDAAFCTRHLPREPALPAAIAGPRSRIEFRAEGALTWATASPPIGHGPSIPAEHAPGIIINMANARNEAKRLRWLSRVPGRTRTIAGNAFPGGTLGRRPGILFPRGWEHFASCGCSR